MGRETIMNKVSEPFVMRFSCQRAGNQLSSSYPLGELSVHHEVMNMLLSSGQLEFS